MHSVLFNIILNVGYIVLISTVCIVLHFLISHFKDRHYKQHWWLMIMCLFFGGGIFFNLQTSIIRKRKNCFCKFFTCKFKIYSYWILYHGKVSFLKHYVMYKHFLSNNTCNWFLFKAWSWAQVTVCNKVVHVLPETAWVSSGFSGFPHLQLSC